MPKAEFMHCVSKKVLEEEQNDAIEPGRKEKVPNLLPQRKDESVQRQMEAARALRVGQELHYHIRFRTFTQKLRGPLMLRGMRDSINLHTPNGAPRKRTSSPHAAWGTTEKEGRGEEPARL